jgi:hypothetical protein
MNKHILTIIIIIVAVLGAVQIATAHILSIQSISISEIENKSSDLENKIALYEEKVASYSAMSTIRDQAERMGFIEGKTVFLEIPKVALLKE